MTEKEYYDVAIREIENNKEKIVFKCPCCNQNFDAKEYINGILNFLKSRNNVVKFISATHYLSAVLSCPNCQKDGRLDFIEYEELYRHIDNDNELCFENLFFQDGFRITR